MDEPTFTGCVMTVRLLGYIGLTEDGVENDRFVGCLFPRQETSLSTDGYASLDDLPPKLLSEMQQFLREYSVERGHDIVLTGCHGVADAVAAIERAEKAFE